MMKNIKKLIGSAATTFVALFAFAFTATADNWIDFAADSFASVDDSSKTITINSAEQLALLAKRLQNPSTIPPKAIDYLEGTQTHFRYYFGWTITLTADIDLAGKDWTPIGSASGSVPNFTGHFDGGNHTIRNLKATGTNNVGLFSCIGYDSNGDAATLIENLTIENANVCASGLNSGALVGQWGGGGRIKNVTVKNSTVKGQECVGGVLGYGYIDAIEGCKTIGTSTSPTIILGTGGDEKKIGGIAGFVRDEDTASPLALKDCFVQYVTLTGKIEVGGLLGRLMYKNATVQDNCVANVTLKTTDDETATPVDVSTASPFLGTFIGRDHSGNTITMSGNTTTPPTPVAVIGETPYATLAAAVAEAKAGDTITLVANTAEPQIDVTKTLTIDFGAYTLSRNGDVANGLITVKAEADDLVTLKGTTGGISAGDKFAIEMRGGGNLTIDGGVYKSDSSGALSLQSTSPRRTVTLNGGTLQSGKSAALHLSDANFVMNDGSVIGGSDYYVKAINLTRSDVKIKGGTITSNASSSNGSAVFWVAEGTDNALTISGGVFSGRGALVKNNSSTTVTASITGGTFEGGISPYGEEDKCTVTITGGKFKNKPTTTNYAVLPAGYSAVKNTATGYYEIQRVYAAKIGETKYGTIDEALDAANALAATQSVTVELLMDVTVANNVTVVANTGNTTAFTGDYTLTLGAEDEVTYECSPVLLSRKGEGNVTFGCDVFISDGNIALETSTGINFAATFSGSVSALDWDDEGENGFIGVGTFNGSANAMTGITGGTFNGTVEESKISGGTFNGTVTDSKISGGTFNGTVDLQEWCGISGGTFYCLPVNADGLVSGGTFKKIAIAALEPLLTDASAIKQTDAETLVVIPASTAKAAQVGETSYYSLYEAVTKVAQDGTIKLLADNSESFVAAPQEGVTKFTISGGSYTLSGTIATPEGYELKDNGDGTYSYGVKDMSVAKIGETKYLTLAAAVAEAKAGDTITMLKTVTENLTVKAPNADFAIDLGTYGIGKVFVGFETGTDASEKLTLTGAACSMGAAAYVGQADSDDAKGVAGWEDRKYELNIVGSEKGDTAVTADQFYVRTTGTLNITNATVSYKYVNLYGAINLTDASFVGKGANFYILGRESKKAKDKAIVTLNNSTLDHSIYELRLGSMEGDTMGSGLVVLKNNSILKAQDIILAPNAGGSFGTIAVVSTNSAIQVTKGLTIGAGDFITLVGSTVTLKSITNNGAINIDATGITAPVKVIDYTGTDAMTLDSYGTVNVTGGEAYVEDNDLWVKLPPVCRIGTKGYDTLQQALNEVGEGETIQLLAGTIEEGEITLPTTIKNVTIKGAADFASVIKNTKIARRTDQMDYEGITIEGIDFLNSGFLFIGDHSVKSILSDFVIKNNKFHDYVTAVNEAPVHFNLNETSPIVNLTFTGNVIDGVSGSDASGLYAYASGNVTVTGNTINNVTFRPILIGIADTDGIADVTIVTGNTFSGSAKGRLQIYGSEDDDCKPIGTDNGSFIVNSNIFKGVTATQQICCWGINTAKVTTDITGNYYDAENPKMFWNDYNGVSSFYISDKQWSANLPHANSTYFNYYTELNEDGTIKESSKVEVRPSVAQVISADGSTTNAYTSLEAAVGAAESGDTVRLIANSAESAVTVVAQGKTVTIDLNGCVFDGTIRFNGTLSVVDTVGTGYIDCVNFWGLVGNGSLTLDASLGCAVDDRIAMGVYTESGSITLLDNAKIYASMEGVRCDGGILTIEANPYVMAYAEDVPALSLNGGCVARIAGGTYKGSFALAGDDGTQDVQVTGGRFSGYCENSVVNFGTGATVAISGGIFEDDSAKDYLASGYEVVANTDPATSQDYPYMVSPAPVAKIGESKYATIGEAIVAANAAAKTAAVQIDLLADVTIETNTLMGTPSYDITVVGDKKWTVAEGVQLGGKYRIIFNCPVDVKDEITYGATAGIAVNATFNGPVTVDKISVGKFYGAVTAETILGNGNFFSGAVVTAGAISGGTFNTGTEVTATSVSGGTFYVVPEAEVSGGTFYIDPSKKADLAEQLVEGKDLKMVAANTYVVIDPITKFVKVGETAYNSYFEALQNVADGGTMTLVADTAEYLTVPAGKTVSLDLADKVASNSSAIYQIQAGAVVVKGSADSKIGGLTLNNPSAMVTVDATFAGKIDAIDVKNNAGTLVLNGGWVKSDIASTASRYLGDGVFLDSTVVDGYQQIVPITEENAVMAVISGTNLNYFASVSKAVAKWQEADGSRLMLMKDIVLNGGNNIIAAGKTLTIDLNGKTWKANDAQVFEQTVLILNSGNLIVEGSNGGSMVSDSSCRFIDTAEGTTVTVNGGSLICEDGTATAIMGRGDVLVTGGMISSLSVTGTFVARGGTFGFDPSANVAEGFTAIKVGESTWTVGVKIDPGSGEKTVPAVEQASDSTVNETAVDKVVTDEEVADKMKTETSVLGVKLTTESPSEGVASGMQAVVDLAKQDAEIKAALETASMVTVKVDVVVSPVKYTPPVAEATVGSVSFNLTPIATVTVISTNGTVTTTKSKNVDVSNTMIDTNQNIVVSLYTGFKPALLVHKDDNGKLIETFAEQDFLFADGTCTLTIHHFSEIDAEQDPSYVAMIGDTKYTSLQDAFDMVAENTQTTVALLKDIELTETATLAANKAATLDLSGRTISWKSTVSEKSNGLVSSAGELDLVNGTLDAGDGNVFATCASDGIVNIVSGTYDGAFPDATGIATNAGPIFVSGGRFSSKIPAAFCAVGYLPNDTPSAVDGRYTVKDAETFIRNICAKQRYPWNGYVDITFEMRMNAVKDRPVRVFVAAYDSAGARIAGLEEVAWLKDDGSKPTVNVKDGSFKVAAPALTKIHLLWNSAIVFPDQKVEGITFKVFAK